MNQPVELLPCPFCGNIPAFSNDDDLTWIRCPNGSICDGSAVALVVRTELIDQGIKVWNTRNGKIV
jgi:hypothetical protein